MFELTIFLRNRLLGRSTFSDEEVRIGRNPDNEVQIDNLALSRYHASIEFVNGLHVLKDFGSQNGTVVNGEAVVGRRALNDNDRIGIGKFTILFRREQAEEKVEGPDIRHKAAYAVGGETLVSSNKEAQERTCPFLGYLEVARPQTTDDPPIVHPLARDTVLVGSAPECDLIVDGAPPRAALVVRGWRGFSLVSLAPGVKVNGASVDPRVDLSAGDQVDVPPARFKFHVSKPGAAP